MSASCAGNNCDAEDWSENNRCSVDWYNKINTCPCSGAAHQRH
jgi:hypothetical protein